MSVFPDMNVAGRNYYFKANDSSDMMEWVRVLKDAIKITVSNMLLSSQENCIDNIHTTYESVRHLRIKLRLRVVFVISLQYVCDVAVICL